jgi:hypothetical protein
MTDGFSGHCLGTFGRQEVDGYTASWFGLQITPHPAFLSDSASADDLYSNPLLGALGEGDKQSVPNAGIGGCQGDGGITIWVCRLTSGVAAT